VFFDPDYDTPQEIGEEKIAYGQKIRTMIKFLKHLDLI